MSLVLRSKVFAKVSVAMIFFMGAASSWANYNLTNDLNETYGLLDTILSVGETSVAKSGSKYGNSEQCNNVRSCGYVVFKKLAVGKYEVRMTRSGNPAEGIDLQAIALGNDSVRCKIGTTLWNPAGDSQARFSVLCHDLYGRLADSKFFVSALMGGARQMGSSTIWPRKHSYAAVRVYGDGSSGRLAHANSFNFSPWLPEPGDPYTIATQKFATGVYFVVLHGWTAADINSVRLTAVGNNSNFCTVHPEVVGDSTLKKAGVVVFCHNNSGGLVDSVFNLLVEKSYKGPKGKGAQKTLANKQHGSWTDWDYIGKGMSLSLADFNSSIQLEHKGYTKYLSFPFVTSMMPNNYCKIASYDQTTISGTNRLNVKIKCYEAGKGLSPSILGWNFTSNLVSAN